MLQLILRVLVGVLGLLGLALAARFWMDPMTAAEGLGLSSLNDLGTATLRADLGAFFGTTGLFCLAAALLNRAALMSAPIALFGLALAGRTYSLLMFGPAEGGMPPMIVEGVTLAFFALGRFFLGPKS
ncbi:MAG: hypothetical protein ACFB6R_06195 [Alphaproteobacteria bacterium]